MNIKGSKKTFLKKGLVVAISSATVFALSPVLAAEDRGYALEEIIVTASKREENLQNESRSISVVSGDTLARAGIFDVQDIQNEVAGLTINRNSQNLQVSVRGVGDRTINNATDPAVAINIDGIYYPRTYQVTGSFFDLERVEVLKGPQGTLYGRNATAGALNVETVKPKFENSGFFETEVGNFNHLRLTGAANFELSDTMAIRISGQAVDRDGYLSDGYNDDENQAVRVGFIYQPSDDTSLLISSSYTDLGGLGHAAVIAERFSGAASLFTNPSDPWAGPTDPATLARIAESNPGVEIWPQTNGFRDIQIFTLSATLEHNLGWSNLTITPSYISDESKNLNWGSMIVGGFGESENETLSMEVRLSSPDDSDLKWVAGSYWSKEEISEYGQSTIPFGDLIGGDGISEGFIIVTDTPVRDTQAWAIFGEMNYSVSDETRLIAGIRYTEEDKDKSAFSYNYGFPFGPPVVKASGGFEHYSDFPLKRGSVDFPTINTPGAQNVSGSRSDDAFNFRLGIEHDLSASSMLYATVATGFKAGGFFDSLPGFNDYKAEELTAYTIGAKNRFLDDRLQVNLEVFSWDYTDKQETFLGFVPGFGNVLQTRNAGEVSLQGIEASIIGQLTENDRISLFMEYVDSEYDEYRYLTPAGAAPSVPFGNCTITLLDNGDGIFGPGDNEQTDCSGNPLVRGPDLSGRLAYTHIQPIGSSGDLIFNIGMTFSSEYFFANDFSSLEAHPSYKTYDAILSWESASERWTATAWVKNISDENVYHGGLQSNTLPDAAVGQIGAPRTYGVRLKYNF